MVGFNIRLVGNPEYPNFILDEGHRLPITVEGNVVMIRDKFDNHTEDMAVEFGKGKINFEKIEIEFGTMLINILYKSEKLPIFKIRLSNGLYLHDFKYIGKNTPRYPIFALYDPKIIYTQQHAQQTIEKLEEEGYKGLSLDTPLFDGLKKA